MPILAPGGSPSSGQLCRFTKTSRGSSLASTAPKTRPSVNWVGMSLRLCTAMSSLPSKSSCSSSLTKIPRPMPAKGEVWSTSPLVRTVSTSKFRAGLLAFRRLITTWSWIRAKALPRLPTLMAGPPELPELSSESLVVKGLAPRGLGRSYFRPNCDGFVSSLGSRRRRIRLCLSTCLWNPCPADRQAGPP